MDKETARERASDLEAGLAQMEQIKSQVEAVRRQADSLRGVFLDQSSSLEVLEGLRSGGPGEIFIPLGGMVFVRASVKDRETCLLDRGAGIYAQTDLASAVEVIKERMDGMNGAISSLDKSLQELLSGYNEIAKRTQELYEGQMIDEKGPEGSP